MTDLKDVMGGLSFIPVIVGPTASGKSDIALKLAEAAGGEIVSCDSMQIYKGLDIGTAKPNKDEQGRVRHHMIDIIDPDQNYSVNEFYEDANRCVGDIISRHKLPILCGGTGQYVSAMIKGINFGDEDGDKIDEVIDQLYSRFESEGIDSIYEDLKSIDPQAASKIHPNNTRRVIRAYAVYLATGRTFTQKNMESLSGGSRYPYKLFQPDLDRSAIYERINLRVDKMISSGLLKEAKWLYETYPGHDTTAFQAIGYKELFPYITGEISLDRAIYDLKLNTRHYAKRQLTWFRYIPDITMIDPGHGDIASEIMAHIQNGI